MKYERFLREIMIYIMNMLLYYIDKTTWNVLKVVI